MSEQLRNLYLLVAGDCNLECSYCYAQQGRSGGGPRAMSPETLRAALEKLIPEETSLLVSFFGGEPLLELDLLHAAVAWGNTLGTERGTRLRYALTTNGTLLDEARLEFIKHHISHVAVSLDGEPALTDASRCFKTGEESVHRTVTHNLQRLRRAGIPYGLRSTIPEGKAGELAAAANHLESLTPASLRIEAATGATPWRREAWQQWTEETVQLGEKSFRQLLSGGRPLLSASVYRTAAYRLRGEKRHYPCLAGQGILAVAPSGDVYPCDHFVGADAFCMGNVRQSGFPGDDYHRVAERLQFNRVDDRPKCTRCRIRHICGGECPAVSLMRQGNIADPSPSYCSHARRIFRRTEEMVDTALTDPAMRNRLIALVKGG